jgi:hypothetical protein
MELELVWHKNRIKWRTVLEMWICDKTIHGICTMIMHLLNSSLLVYEFLAKTQHCNDAQASMFTRHGPMRLFLFPKIKRTLKCLAITSINKVKKHFTEKAESCPKDREPEVFLRLENALA